ncbi:hypothetical protein [Glycomyces paridis]|uniref:Uncharacterized protein n=1 Tax=Glycomyces paridis TaxID=2126555 RepID=A0A4V4HNQ8_9ACTN|nr:hypothetical protein [Glycomyces paridis]THV27066.1 hypothetical protein E9998_16475 [Glycomyces paridis]
MYAWIWSKLPFGLPGKIVGSLALGAGTVALLWLVLFPAVRPHMPWSNVDPAGGVNVEQPEDGEPAESPTCTPGVDCQGTGFDPEDWQTAESPDGESED